MNAKGKVLDGAEAQIEQAWRNVADDAAGGGRRALYDLVKVTIFLTDRGHLQILRDIRDAMLQGAAGGCPDFRSRSASADWLVEIGDRRRGMIVGWGL